MRRKGRWRRYKYLLVCKQPWSTDSRCLPEADLADSTQSPQCVMHPAGDLFSPGLCATVKPDRAILIVSRKVFFVSTNAVGDFSTISLVVN